MHCREADSENFQVCYKGTFTYDVCAEKCPNIADDVKLLELHPKRGGLEVQKKLVNILSEWLQK